MNILTTDLKDLRDSNAFLRALWAELRTRFGKCAWQYQPSKKGMEQLISLGQMDLGAGQIVPVSLKYKTRSILAEVHLSLDQHSDLAKRISDAAHAALERRATPREMFLQVSVSALRMTLAPYRGEWFRIEPMGRGAMTLSLRVRAFDRLDAKSEFLRRLPLVLDILAVETNHLFWANRTKGSGRRSGSPPAWNIFATDDQWIDEYPSSGSYSLISREAHALIEEVLSAEQLTDAKATFVRACHHYHVAREQDALVYDRLVLRETRHRGKRKKLLVAEDRRLVLAAEFSRRAEEIATLLYMSSVEVASTIGAPAPDTCGECGQDRYRISARVAAYAAARMPYIADMFKRHYSMRSKYLHTGAVLVDHSYTGTTIPLLDPSSESGMTQRTTVLLRNMREWIGYLLRQQLKEMRIAPVPEESD